MKGILLTLLISTLCLSAYCQDTAYVYDSPRWIYIGASDANDKWYGRSEYESKDWDGSIKIWLKLIQPTFTYNKRNYKNSYKVELAQVDCKAKRMKSLSFIYYTSAGNVIYKEDYSSEYKPIVPDTVMEMLYEWVCEKYKN